MQAPKISVALICGGQSPEHEISLMSSQNILNAINPDKFETHVIYISKSGKWFYADSSFHSNLSQLPEAKLSELLLMPNAPRKEFFILKDENGAPYKSLSVDIAFPALHGQLGEDGTIQGLFKMLNCPFVGNDVLSSSMCMDKDVAKRLLSQANVPIPAFLVFHAQDKSSLKFHDISKKLGLPFFLKPANAGSSVGVSKIKNENDFTKAIDQIFYYDEKILAETFIEGRELECAVLGNENPIASKPGEIICHHEFYSYQAKYIDENGADVVVPADLSNDEIKAFQEVAIKAYKTLCCSGLARIDFFYSLQKHIYVNEINTLPGFTNISMYPKCFEHSGYSYSELVEKLLLLGLEKQRIHGY